MKSNKFNITLSHSNISMNINNKVDIEGIDHVLKLVIENKNNTKKLIDIVKNTSFKYLERLDEDGLFRDKGGAGIVPVYKPIVTDKAIEFMKAGGYSALFKEPKKNWVHTYFKEIIISVIAGIILWFIIEYVLIPSLTK